MIGATQVSSENSNRIVEVRNLSKRFGPTSALANVSLDVCKNEAVLVAGPNGSGKSTLLKILCGIMRHSNKGRVCVLGLDPWKYRHVLFGKVAASFEDYSFPELVSGKDYLEFIARIREVNEATMYDSLEGLFGLGNFWEKSIREYSSGMRRKLALAQLFIGEREVIFLDEPFIALDRLTRLQLVEELRRLKAKGATLIMSTHLLTDLDGLVSRMIVLINGQLCRDVAVSAETTTVDEQFKIALQSV